jgi:hypothetical protein
VHAYNTSVHTAIKNTPFYVMFGRDPLPLMQNVAPPVPIARTVTQWLQNMKTTQQEVGKLLQLAQQRNKQIYDQQAQPKEFNIGDLVLLRVQQVPSTAVAKLHPKFVGPFRVVDIKNAVLSVVPLRQPTAAPKRIHSDHARICSETFALPMRPDQLNLPFTEPADIDPNLEAEAPEQDLPA